MGVAEAVERVLPTKRGSSRQSRPACILNAGMKRVLTALILAPLVLVLVFMGPMWLITAVVAGVAMLAAHSRHWQLMTV